MTQRARRDLLAASKPKQASAAKSAARAAVDRAMLQLHPLVSSGEPSPKLVPPLPADDADPAAAPAAPPPLLAPAALTLLLPAFEALPLELGAPALLPPSAPPPGPVPPLLPPTPPNALPLVPPVLDAPPELPPPAMTAPYS